MQFCICLVGIKFNLELNILKTDNLSQLTKDVSYSSNYTCSDYKLSILVFLEYYFLNLTINICLYQLPLLCLVGMDMSYLTQIFVSFLVNQARK